MLKLYYRPTCPFCVRVLEASEGIGAPLSLIDISQSSVATTELIELGGKRQVPFLHDTDRGVMMYESRDIIAYLMEYYQGDNRSGEGSPVCLFE